MQRSSRVLLLALATWGFVVACSRPRATPTLPDGLYALVEDSTGSRSGRTLRHDPRIADPNSSDPPSSVTVDTTSYVPLVLARAPESIPQSDGRIWLHVALAGEYVKALEDFTRTHLGGRVAVVLDGEVITVHVVKAVIEGGQLQLSRCGDRGCEAIRARLLL